MVNPLEENLTNQWSDFLVRRRRYSILIRNLLIPSMSEFDAIGVRFRSPFESDPWLESIEAAWTKPGHIESRQKKIMRQLEKRKNLYVFNALLGLTNDVSVFASSMNPVFGKVLVEQNASLKGAYGIILKTPIEMVQYSSARREMLLRVIRRLYRAANAVRLPVVFCRCEHSTCSYYYGFSATQPLPEQSSSGNHSSFCPQNTSHANRFYFHAAGLSFGVGEIILSRRQISVR